MGDSASKPSKKNHFEEYQLISLEEDDRFGEIQLYRHKSHLDLIWVKETILQSSSISKKIQKYVESKEWQDPMFLTTKVISERTSSTFGMCTQMNKSDKLTIVMEFLEHSLEEEIFKRGTAFEVIIFNLERFFFRA